MRRLCLPIGLEMPILFTLSIPARMSSSISIVRTLSFAKGIAKRWHPSLRLAQDGNPNVFTSENTLTAEKAWRHWRTVVEGTKNGKLLPGAVTEIARSMSSLPGRGGRMKDLQGRHIRLRLQPFDGCPSSPGERKGMVAAGTTFGTATRPSQSGKTSSSRP